MPPILPKKAIIDTAKLRRAVAQTLDTSARDVVTDFEQTTATWRHDAPFVIRPTAPWQRDIFTDDRIWQMLNAGTREHMIFPRRASRLAFKTPFRSKTLPRSLSSGPGAVGSQQNYALGVMHPGTEARDWDLTAAIKWVDEFPERVARAIKEAL